MKTETIFTLTTVVSVAIFAIGFGACANNRSDPARMVNGKQIYKEMTDAQILAVFDVDISNAESKRVPGKDGYSMEYKLGEQSVTITRSEVTGASVLASGPIKGVWIL